MIARKFALALAILCAAPAAFSAELPLKVMSFNVRYGVAHDGENNWPNRQDIAVGMLREYDADIIGTQELLPFQADYLVKWMPEYRWFGAPRGDYGLPERSAILYKWRDFIVLDSGTFWLSETPEVYGSRSWDSRYPRVATWARFVHRGSGRTFHVYNTHFDHIGREARINGMKVILDHVEANTGGGPVILMGDFNIEAGDNAVYTAPMEADFADAWLVAAEQKGPTATWGAFADPDPDSTSRIDWILTKGSVGVDLCETVLYNEGGRYPSDHYPVFARLRLAGGEESE